MGKQSNVERKSLLVLGLREVRQEILKSASGMNPETRGEAYLGVWSIAEMLAHLAGWDETNIRAADEILGGELPGFYEYSDKDWKSYNAKLVSAYARSSFDEVVSLVHDTHKALIGRLEAISPDELWRDRGIRAKGWVVTIGRLLEAELADEKEHLSQLQAFIEEGIIN